MTVKELLKEFADEVHKDFTSNPMMLYFLMNKNGDGGNLLPLMFMMNQNKSNSPS